jgi:hypothetical protein
MKGDDRRARSMSGGGPSAPLTRRRARLASCRGVGQQRLLLRVKVAVRDDDRIGKVPAEQILVAAPAGAQQMQALPRDHRRQPPAQVVDLFSVGLKQA